MPDREQAGNQEQYVDRRAHHSADARRRDRLRDVESGAAGEHDRYEPEHGRCDRHELRPQARDRAFDHGVDVGLLFGPPLERIADER